MERVMNQSDPKPEIKPTLDHLSDPYVLQLIEAIGQRDDRIEELERDLDNERARGIHTCHSKCQRPLCVAHRRIAELEAQCRFHIAEAKNADELVLKENRKLLTRIAELEAENERLQEQLDEQNEIIKDLDNALAAVEVDDD
jgi:hypothetical protein